MSRKRSKRHKRGKLTPVRSKPAKRRWKLTIDSKEASINFYSILIAFQRANGGGLINKEALKYVNIWIDVILEHDPDIERRVNDTRGPFRSRDMSPLNISLELDNKEKDLMLFIRKSMYSQLITPKSRDNWIRNQGREDYELAVKNYRGWIDSLEGEGYVP